MYSNNRDKFCFKTGINLALLVRFFLIIDLNNGFNMLDKHNNTAQKQLCFNLPPSITEVFSHQITNT